MEDIQVLYIIFGIIGIGFISLSVFLGIYLHRRWKTRTVLFNIVGVDGKLRFKRINNPKDINEVYGHSYTYDQKCEVPDRWNKSIFYYEGIPDPILFDRTSITPKVTSKALNNIVEDDFIRKLFNPASPLSLENILGYITIGLVVIMLYLLVFDNISVNLANTPETIDLIKNACRSAVLGG